MSSNRKRAAIAKAERAQAAAESMLKLAKWQRDAYETLSRLLQDRVKAAELKAERYDRLRNGLDYVVKCGSTTFHCGGHRVQKGAFGYPEAFDKAVDEAIALEKANEAAHLAYIKAQYGNQGPSV